MITSGSTSTREGAAAGPFGTTIAHGLLTLVPMPSDQIFRIEGLSMAVNCGCDRIWFPVPAPVESRVRARIELVSLKLNCLGHLMTSLVTIEIDSAQKPACVADSLAVVVPSHDPLIGERAAGP
ncbi:hotdog family protein [Streptomyces luteolifulvus]|uniref:MaoC/PaaZ C-terminal domain-containing protein n=1 Tax=Streptomyces luteolifulvus TaxID=2615112 RepID=UPI001CD973AB|nr:MaoC/PaaZ C-terminal domain-containing protein [Streptomyces luteolifulvus]